MPRHSEIPLLGHFIHPAPRCPLRQMGARSSRPLPRLAVLKCMRSLDPGEYLDHAKGSFT
jgi:hypothetical protein